MGVRWVKKQGGIEKQKLLMDLEAFMETLDAIPAICKH
jgi:hypothetical protein